MNTSTLRTPPAAGSLCLLLGFVLAVMVLTVRLNANWGVMGRVVTRNPVMCWAMSVGLMVAGAVLIKQHPSTDEAWSPQVPGKRFREAILYTRHDCTLCDEAAITLAPYQGLLPPLQKVDVDTESQLRDEFGNCVPVLMLDGKVRFRGHVNETLLQRLIEGTPPV